MKRVISARIEEKLAKRLEKVAEQDHRTLGNVVELCVLRYLPEFEAEVLGSGEPVAKVEVPA